MEPKVKELVVLLVGVAPNPPNPVVPAGRAPKAPPVEAVTVAEAEDAAIGQEQLRRGTLVSVLGLVAGNAGT